MLLFENCSTQVQTIIFLSETSATDAVFIQLLWTETHQPYNGLILTKTLFLICILELCIHLLYSVTWKLNWKRIWNGSHI